MTNEEAIEYIRFWLGNLPESVISDEDMGKIIDLVRLQYPNISDCELLYRSTVAVLEWLIRQDSQGSSGTVGSGEVKKRTEERGRTKVSQEWDVGTTGGTTGSWSSILDDLLQNPDSIGCSVFAIPTSGEIGSVVFGITKNRFETSAPWRQNAKTPTKKTW